MYQLNELDTLGAVRRPIQCQGIDRGPKRLAEIGVAGSVNPQINWGNVLGSVASNLPNIISSFF
jgi:hypothetical protein